jgi:tRNA (cmo5U34)-methyltransferase
VLAPGGQFVLADIVVPDDPADVVTTIDGEYDTPSRAADQVGWMADAGLDARVVWSSKDLAVLVGDLPAG